MALILGSGRARRGAEGSTRRHKSAMKDDPSFFLGTHMKHFHARQVFSEGEGHPERTGWGGRTAAAAAAAADPLKIFLIYPPFYRFLSFFGRADLLFPPGSPITPPNLKNDFSKNDV